MCGIWLPPAAAFLRAVYVVVAEGSPLLFRLRTRGGDKQLCVLISREAVEAV